MTLKILILALGLLISLGLGVFTIISAQKNQKGMAVALWLVVVALLGIGLTGVIFNDAIQGTGLVVTLKNLVNSILQGIAPYIKNFKLY